MNQCRKKEVPVCSTDGTIALISHASKVMLPFIQHRLDMYMEQEIAMQQAGFRKGRGTRYQIANLRWIMKRWIEYQRQIYLAL